MNAAVVVLVVVGATILASAALALGVAVLVRLRQFDAATRHTLWFATLLAIAVLPLIGFGTSIFRGNHAPAVSTNSSWSGAVAGTTHVTASTVYPSTSEVSRSPLRTARANPWHALAKAGTALSVGLATTIDLILAAGALVGLGILTFNVARIRAVKRRSSPLDGELARELPWLTDPSIGGRETYLRLSYEIETPVAIGFQRPVILIPTELATHRGLEAIEDLVVHEHAHLRRWDDYTNLVQRAIERAFWFNPVVWFVGSKVALEREIAADDIVVARNVEVTRYAESLWRLAREMRMPAHTLVAPGALFTRKQISVRIEALLAPGRARLAHLGPATAAGALALALACGTLVALAAPALELPAPPRAPTVALPAVPRTPDWKAPAAAVHASLPKPAERLGALDAPHSNLVVKGPSVDAPSVHVDVPAQRVEVPGQRVEVPAIHVEVPAVHVEVPAVHVEVPREAHVAPVARVPRLPVSPPGFDPAQIAQLQASSSEVARAATQQAAQEVAAAVGGVRASKSDPPPSTLTRSVIANCVGCDLSHRDLRGMDLHGIDVSGSDFSGADLRNANLAGARLRGADLSHANLDGADLSDAELVGVDISDASFRGARLDGLRMTGMALRGAKFDSLRAVLLAGCSGCDLSHMDLHGMDLHGVSLVGADLGHSDLSGADLRNARLSGVSFNRADLRGTDFRGATLTGCSLDGADFSGARFEGAALSGTSLHQ